MFDIRKHRFDRSVSVYGFIPRGGIALKCSFVTDKGYAIAEIEKQDVIALAKYFNLTTKDIKEK